MTNPSQAVHPPSILVLEGVPGTLSGRLPRTGLGPRVQVHHRVGDVREALDGCAPLVLLTDLQAPDGRGVEGLLRLEPDRRVFPILACVPAALEHLGRKAIEAGAEDFLVVDDTTPVVLLRAVRTSVWRRARTGGPRGHELWEEVLRGLEEVLHREQVLPEWRELPPLSEEAPGRFVELSAEYGQLLDTMAAPDSPGVNGGARRLAEALGVLRAGPVDLVALHKRGLEERAQAPPDVARRYVSEGRLLLLQVMGWLAAYYRARVGETESGRPSGGN